MATIIASMELDEFMGQVRWDGLDIRILLAGAADMASQQVLRTLLRDAHAGAKRHHARRAVIDVRSLRFMASSCICALLGWTNTVASEREENQYPIEVLWDPGNGWERRSLEAIVRVASVALTLEPPL
jgi:hypothetical protein